MVLDGGPETIRWVRASAVPAEPEDVPDPSVTLEELPLHGPHPEEPVFSGQGRSLLPSHGKREPERSGRPSADGAAAGGVGSPGRVRGKGHLHLPPSSIGQWKNRAPLRRADVHLRPGPTPESRVGWVTRFDLLCQHSLLESRRKTQEAGGEGQISRRPVRPEPSLRKAPGRNGMVASAVDGEPAILALRSEEARPLFPPPSQGRRLPGPGRHKPGERTPPEDPSEAFREASSSRNKTATKCCSFNKFAMSIERMEGPGGPWGRSGVMLQ